MIMRADDALLAGFGACCAVGRDIESTAAAIRAGVSGFTEHPFMFDTAAKRMRVAAAPWLTSSVTSSERLEALLVPAISEALGDISRNGVRLALALALPGPRPGLPGDLSSWARTTISSHFPQTFVTVASFQNGHAAAFLALEAVLGGLQRGTFDACIVGGVDTFMAPDTLEWLEASDQLQGAGPLNNAWGFVPGEAAAALLIETRAVAERHDQELLGHVLTAACAMEPNRIKTPTVCLGHGLSAAIQRILTVRPPQTPVTDIYNDLNGEPYRADEYGFAMARHSEAFVRPSDMVTPADCTGDVGAASGPLHIAIAAMAARKRYAAGTLAMVHASSESGERGAALIEFA